MLQPFRSEFNARFTPAKYAALISRLNRECRTEIEFRIAETPCFFPRELLEEMIEAGKQLTDQLLGNAEYLRLSEAAIPQNYDVPGCDAHPHFMTVDFGLVRDEDGRLTPKLVEMQAFPSIFGFQPGFARAYKDIFELDDQWAYLYAGLDEPAYWSLLREVIVAGHDPAEVVLLELDPENQKTLADFRMTEEHLGIRAVDVRSVVKEGARLFYRDALHGGRLTPIKRIYNRVIVDELIREDVTLPFDYREALDVEWAGHPNWYFRISKLSLPYLQHPTVPAAVFLDAWFAGEGRELLPSDRERLVLKPLYSFAGKGIQFAPSDVTFAAIPKEERRHYLLQERVHFEPVIETPEGLTQAEVRILYVWPEGKQLTPMTSLVRMGRGLMMGVDHNRDRTWVGGSAGLFLPGGADNQGNRITL